MNYIVYPVNSLAYGIKPLTFTNLKDLNTYVNDKIREGESLVVKAEVRK